MLRRDFLLTASKMMVATAALSSQRAFAQAPGLKARGVYSAPGLSFAGLFIASNAKLWAANGLDLDLRQVQGGPLAMAAMTNREADFAGVAASDPIIGWDKGIKTIAVAAFTGALSMQFTARNDWLMKKGLAPDAPIADRLKAFKGARIGASTIGGGPAQYTRYLLRSVGIDPDRDVKILAVGFGASRMAALRTNQVDVTVGDAPEADQIELEGFGKLFVNCAQEIPEFEQFPYTVLTVTPDVAEQKADVVRRVVHAVGEANDMFTKNLGQAMDIMKATFPNVPPAAIERAVGRDKAIYPRGGRMSEAMWRNSLKVSAAIKMIGHDLPAQEGVLWTNKFTS